MKKVSKMKKNYANCNCCGIVINFGESHKSIVLNVEKTELCTHKRMLVFNVLDSEQILTLCNECGDSLKTEKISELICDNITNGDDLPF